LRENNDYLRSPDRHIEEKLDGLLFEVGLLIDLLDNVTWEVADMIPADHDSSDHQR